ncbi:MAG TPA: stimulus-sensing domain-containing protein [Rhizomicrobium sp.]|nr:stimulus-sensing domain-containing protein [Rhizomicrobium sp.]
MPHFSALTWRILAFNTLALLILTGGVIGIQSSGRGLVEERLTGIQEQAAIVANTLAEFATDPNTHTLDVDAAEPLLRQLIAPTRLRARLYLPNGHQVVDTRLLLARNIVQVSDLPPLGRWDRVKAWAGRIYDGVMGVRPFTQLPSYSEGGEDGRIYQEVDDAITGQTSSAERVDDQNKLVLSVAVPIQRFRAIYGELFITTEGGDIDDILRQERFTLLEVIFVAFAVMLLSSFYLSGTIAEPVRHLAAAADLVRQGRAGRDAIPGFPERNDEIGDLADSLKEMTSALYDRIGAIERFAADVAHELKNPLTSLASAMEMLVRAPDEAARQKLMVLVRADVKRINRLITDISDASRLDAELSRETRTEIDLSHLLKIIVEIYDVTEHGKNVAVSLADTLPAGTKVMGHDERLGQVFRNLIDNAISFTPEGGSIVISARRHHAFARVTVEDNGPGIPPDNLESIFERFYTERPGDTFGKNSGLGLSIARQITQNAGGRVWAENRPPIAPGKASGGARFVVELPIVNPEA